MTAPRPLAYRHFGPLTNLAYLSPAERAMAIIEAQLSDAHDEGNPSLLRLFLRPDLAPLLDAVYDASTDVMRADSTRLFLDAKRAYYCALWALMLAARTPVAAVALTPCEQAS